MNRTALALVVPALLAAVTAVAAVAAGVAAQLPPTSKARLSMRVPVPPAVVVTGGLHRLLYELHVENRGDAAVTLSSVEIRLDSATSGITVDGDRLIRALDVPANRKAPLSIAAGPRRVAFLDLGEARPPRVVHHVVRSTPHAPAPASAAVAEDTLDVTVDATPPVVLGAPLAGGPWAAVYHSDWERGHRRVFYTVDGVERLPGRYTIDFVKLDDAGRKARGDGDVDLVEQSSSIASRYSAAMPTSPRWARHAGKWTARVRVRTNALARMSS